MRVRDLIEALNLIAPPEFAEPWDRVGLHVGRADAPIDGPIERYSSPWSGPFGFSSSWGNAMASDSRMSDGCIPVSWPGTPADRCCGPEFLQRRGRPDTELSPPLPRHLAAKCWQRWQVCISGDAYWSDLAPPRPTTNSISPRLRRSIRFQQPGLSEETPYPRRHVHACLSRRRP